MSRVALADPLAYVFACHVQSGTGILSQTGIFKLLRHSVNLHQELLGVDRML